MQYQPACVMNCFSLYCLRKLEQFNCRVGFLFYLFRCIGIRFIACHYAISYANFTLGHMAWHSISCFRSNKKDPIFRVLWVFVEKY